MHGGNGDPWRGMRGNLLLRGLPAREALLVAPLLQRVELANGAQLTGDGSAGNLVYFPETAIACLRFPAIDESGLGIGIVGREGALGWSRLIGSEHGGPEGIVQLEGGTAVAVEAGRLATLCATNPALLQALLRFSYLLSLQLAGTLVSNLRDSLEARLCRWILMYHDRLAGDALAITHDALGRLLAVRRATVTDTLHVLEGERLVRCTRARIVVRNRAGLEQRAGSAYGAAEEAYRALQAPFGKNSPK
ncbi:Crp/Fnr family transcriptional regulator [Sphingomonas psychrotolerans]|uniref:Crp/Fnr family transcriptional regulator n=1 Tax=Sphingomonas psychrotolerans TaxID=1327635 RepID=A0ABU3N8J8_9SPHN|nr:Crp/Fnr family transcriptional regulator [Sphingomonas psychrotolerans]